MKNNFEPNEFQGRRMDQVESSYKAIGWATAAFIIYMVGLLGYTLIEKL